MNQKNTTKITKKGLVIGKFYPLHEGHVRMLNFASASVNELFVVVESQAHEWIDGETRCAWVREAIPKAHIIHLKDKNLPQDNKVSGFWDIWIKTFQEIAPKPDFVIAGEEYGREIAQRLGANFLPYYRNELSGTMCRNNLDLYWDKLSIPAKRYFQKRYVLLGAESTGKSFTSKIVSEKLGIQHQEEYAGLYFKGRSAEVSKEDIEALYAGGKAWDQYAPTHQMMLRDTDLFQTMIWDQFLFNQHQKHKLLPSTYLLIDHQNLPWVSDYHRTTEERANRDKFLKLSEEMLMQYGLEYQKITAKDFQSLAGEIEKLSV